MIKRGANIYRVVQTLAHATIGCNYGFYRLGRIAGIYERVARGYLSHGTVSSYPPVWQGGGAKWHEEDMIDLCDFFAAPSAEPSGGDSMKNEMSTHDV